MSDGTETTGGFLVRTIVRRCNPFLFRRTQKRVIGNSWFCFHLANKDSTTHYTAKKLISDIKTKHRDDDYLGDKK